MGNADEQASATAMQGEVSQWSSVAEIRDVISSGIVTSLEVTDAFLERIEAVDPILHFYAEVTSEQARVDASAADAWQASGRPVGSLHGAPIGIKDNVWTAGIVTTNGLATNDDFVPSMDATVVRRLKDAGAIVLGKLAQTEGVFAGHRADVPSPVNPWSGDLWPGASSSGSGVATSAGLCEVPPDP